MTTKTTAAVVGVVAVGVDGPENRQLTENSRQQGGLAAAYSTRDRNGLFRSFFVFVPPEKGLFGLWGYRADRCSRGQGGHNHR